LKNNFHTEVYTLSRYIYQIFRLFFEKKIPWVNPRATLSNQCVQRNIWCVSDATTGMSVFSPLQHRARNEPTFGKIYYCTEGRNNKGFLHFRQSRCTLSSFCKHSHANSIIWLKKWNVERDEIQSNFKQYFSNIINKYFLTENGEIFVFINLSSANYLLNSTLLSFTTIWSWNDKYARISHRQYLFSFWWSVPLTVLWNFQRVRIVLLFSVFLAWFWINIKREAGGGIFLSPLIK
jgi:hypothetical protein